MHLYRHSTECLVAIQMFLDQNPRYWRFVPMTYEDANHPAQMITMSTLDMKMMAVRSHDEIDPFIRDLPTPPANYRFSKRQNLQQYAFFLGKKDLIMPNLHLDLYNAKIIAVSK
jgi:hypothetical protein